MAYYTIEQNPKDNNLWDVVTGRTTVIGALGSAEFADRIAQALNTANTIGQNEAKEEIKERMIELLFEGR